MSSSALWKQAAGRIIGSLIFAAIVNGALFGYLRVHPTPIAVPKSQRQTTQDIEGMHAAARDAQIPVMESLLAKNTAVDVRDAEQATPLMRAGDGKTAEWLIAHGANVNAVNYQGDTALMLAAGTGNAEVVKALIKGKADVNIVSTKWNSTALQRALDNEKLDVAQILRDAGAHDVTVTAKNGKPVGKNSEPVRAALKYLDAIQHQDVAAIRGLSTRAFDKDVDWKAVKESRPIDPGLVGGFANENAATLSLRGKRADGVYTTWTLQLEHASGGWKVSDERWETRFDSKSF
jgi:ankyrin repeat protein